MPNYAALAIAVFIGFVDGFDNLFDSKVLLIAAYLFDVGVNQDEITNQFLHAINSEK